MTAETTATTITTTAIIRTRKGRRAEKLDAFEKAIVALIYLTDAEIAEILGELVPTVQHRLTAMYERHHCKNRTQLALKLVALGWHIDFSRFPHFPSGAVLDLIESARRTERAQMPQAQAQEQTQSKEEGAAACQ